MTTIVTRLGKGSALDWAEADANFTNLNMNKVEYTVSEPASYDEAANVLHRSLAFDDLGNTTVVPASKQFNYIGIRNAGSPNKFEIGSSGIVAGLTYYLTSTSTSNATSNLYSIIGSLYNEGPGTTKAIYGRVQASSGCTGTVVGSVFRTQIDTGATPSTSWCMQVGPAGDLAKTASAVLYLDHESGSIGTPGKAAFGILQDTSIGWTTAMISGIAGGGGNFLKWQAVGAGATLFSVNEAGDVESATKYKVSTTELSSLSLQRTAVGGNFGIHTQSTGSLYLGGAAPASSPLILAGSNIRVTGAAGSVVDFEGLSSGAAGASAGYITIKVDGVSRKLQYYAVS